MKIVVKFPRPVKVLEEDVWIPLASGHKLAARIWLPEDAEADPLSAEAEMVFGGRLERGDFGVRVEARTRLRATKETFILTADLDVWEGDKRILAKSWTCPIPRDHV